MAHVEALQCSFGEEDAALAAKWKVGKVRCSGCGEWVHRGGFPLHTLAKKCRLPDAGQLETVAAWRASTIQCSGCKTYVARGGLSQHAIAKGCLPAMSSEQSLAVSREKLDRSIRHGRGRRGRGRGRGKTRTPRRGPKQAHMGADAAEGARKPPPPYLVGEPISPAETRTKCRFQAEGAPPWPYQLGAPVYVVQGGCSLAEGIKAAVATPGWRPPPGLEAPPAWVTPGPSARYCDEELFGGTKALLSGQ